MCDDLYHIPGLSLVVKSCDYVSLVFAAPGMCAAKFRGVLFVLQLNLLFAPMQIGSCFLKIYLVPLSLWIDQRIVLL
jgi:hypothetical protein